MGSLFVFTLLFCQLAGSILHFPVSRTNFLPLCISAAKFKSSIEAKDADTLETTMNTTKIELYNMNIGIKDMINIATVLHSNNNITSTNLAYKNINDDGAK